MKAKSLILVAILFVAALAIGTNGAYATTLQLSISDGTNTVTVVDNQAGDSASANLGYITWIGSLGGWDLMTETGMGTPFFGSGASLDTAFIANAMQGTTTDLTIMLTQTGTTTFTEGWSLHIGGTISGGVSPVTYSAYYDNSNVAFGTGTQIGTSLSFSGGGAFAGNIAGAGSPDSEYSLTQVLVFHGTGDSGSATGDALLEPVPEPTAILLLGSGLVGVALLVRRKRS